MWAKINEEHNSYKLLRMFVCVWEYGSIYVGISLCTTHYFIILAFMKFSFMCYEQFKLKHNVNYAQKTLLNIPKNHETT